MAEPEVSSGILAASHDEAAPSRLEGSANVNILPETDPRCLYFFYGTLCQPEVLRRVLDLPEPPPLTPAHIVGFEIKYWAAFRALRIASSDKAQSSVVSGMAYHGYEDEIGYLRRYEGPGYKLHPTTVYVDGQEIPGYTFLWCGNPEVLTDEDIADSAVIPDED
ncbi:unnamed protein product [Somion occarium]|uniref:Gamma-glutamylcyclotransferase AIG2-like domain-containing protein n=1 Tax=Somion occarium TaxID=3059160 RepID=A0ABP1DT77_9APHY